MQAKRLTQFILIGMVLGITAGYACFTIAPEGGTAFAKYSALLPNIFLRLIKMIIAPLVFATLVTGIAKMGNVQTVGRVGVKALGWFVMASLLSLSLGLVFVNLLEPGKAMQLTLPTAGTSGVSAGAMTLEGFISHTVPVSIADAMARNEILQIVVFALFFGCATAALGERSKALVDVLDSVAHIMLKVTSYVMLFAPLAVFGALTSTVAEEGLGIIAVYGIFMGEFYLALFTLWLALIGLGVLILRRRVLTLMRRIQEPLLLAFSTASSEAAYPKTLEELERFGCSNKIASFVLPMGYSFNLDGSMMYCTFAVVFIAQAYGIELSLAQQLMMLLILMLTSKGMAGVPRASLVVIAATLAQFQIPEAGLLLLLGIDHFLDMGRSATNVIGNSIATAVVARWEDELST
jgi:Na+/H+-dicarboxylate symporter